METQGRANGYLPASAFTRKERVVINDDGYHYRTREQKLVGPFETEAATIFALERFVDDKTTESSSGNVSYKS